MRIVKEAAERKNEILDAAAELFAAKGYDETSTGDILDRVGMPGGRCITTSSPRRTSWTP